MKTKHETVPTIPQSSAKKSKRMKSETDLHNDLLQGIRKLGIDFSMGDAEKITKFLLRKYRIYER